ncbi:MAG: ATP synthase F1 subunit epsilon [Rickettsiales bacterium]|nr:ATP synthase F1 subunit epsilon [Rickettsiales bacterium]
MIKVKILTPHTMFLEKECDLVVIPSEDGELGVLENHIDIVSKLEPGEVRIYQNDKVVERCFVFGGLANFSNNEISILADDVKRISELDLQDAESQFKTFSDKQKEVDQDNSDAVFNKVLLYRRMLEVGQRR